MKSTHGVRCWRKLALVSSCPVIVMTGFALTSRGATAQEEEPEFTSDFRLMVRSS